MRMRRAQRDARADIPRACAYAKKDSCARAHKDLTKKPMETMPADDLFSHAI